MKVLSKQEFRDAGLWPTALKLSGLPREWEFYTQKYPNLLLMGSNYEGYRKLILIENTKLGRYLHEVESERVAE